MSTPSQLAIVPAFSDDFEVDGPTAAEWARLSTAGTDYANTAGKAGMVSNTTGSNRKFLGYDGAGFPSSAVKVIARTGDTGGINGVFICGSGTGYADFSGYELTYASGYLYLKRWDGGAAVTVAQSPYFSGGAYVLGLELVPGMDGDPAAIKGYRYSDTGEAGPPGDETEEIAWAELDEPLPPGYVGVSHGVSTAGNFWLSYALIYAEDAAPQLVNVNQGNGIVDGGPIQLSGRNLGGAATASISGQLLTITNNNGDEIDCAPLDVHATELGYGAHDVTLDIAGPVSTTLSPKAGQQHITGTGVMQTGLAEDGGADGDGWEMASMIGQVGVTLLDDTNVIFDPALPDATVVPFWRKPAAGPWAESWVTVTRGIPAAPEITGFVAVPIKGGSVTLAGQTDTALGVVYGIVDPSPDQPTDEQVRDGLNAAGEPAMGAGSAPVTSGEMAVTIGGLPNDAQLYGWMAQWR